MHQPQEPYHVRRGFSKKQHDGVKACGNQHPRPQRIHLVMLLDPFAHQPKGNRHRNLLHRRKPAQEREVMRRFPQINMHEGAGQGIACRKQSMYCKQQPCLAG
ncbi:hypothetical protein D3C76_1097120 [compost metagenome]